MFNSNFFIYFLIHKSLAISDVQDEAGSLMWTQVMVAKNFLENDNLTEISKVNLKIICGMSCAKKPFCSIWCHDEIETCILSSIVVSPNYVETSPDSTKCYTKKRRDLAVGSISSSSTLWSPDSKSEFSADGIFLKDFGLTFKTKLLKLPWVLYNLKKPATIYEIIVSTSMPPQSCKEIEIRIGNDLVTNEDFSAYESLDNIKNTCDQYQYNPLMYFTPSSPMKGQFIVLIRHGNKERSRIKLNYIEIDGIYVA